MNKDVEEREINGMTLKKRKTHFRTLVLDDKQRPDGSYPYIDTNIRIPALVMKLKKTYFLDGRDGITNEQEAKKAFIKNLREVAQKLEEELNQEIENEQQEDEYER